MSEKRVPYSPGEQVVNRVDGERIGQQTPTNYWMPDYDYSDGDKGIWFLDKIGFHLDEWQKLILRDMLARRGGRNGKWAAGEICILVPRQAGKTAVIEARELLGLFVFHERLQIHTAQLYPTARESYNRIRAIIEKHPALAACVHFRSGNDNRSIEISDPDHPNFGGRILYSARGKNAIRGFSGDVIVLDEAYDLDDDTVAAIQYATSARPNPQIIYGSSTGLDDSEVLMRVRERGLKHDPDLALFEWCADPNCDLDDEDQWYQANPALGIRIAVDTVRKERRGQPDRQFARERLGLWNDNTFRSVIHPDVWADCGVADSKITSDYVVAVDATPDRGRASLAVSGFTSEGRKQVEVVRDGSELSWVVEAVADLYASVRRAPPLAVCVQSGASAGSLIPELEARGFRVLKFGQRDIADACGFFYDSVHDKSLVHLRDPALASALGGATQINVGRMNTGNPDDPEFRSWYWGRRDTGINITGLCASTYALWGANLLKSEAEVGKKPYAGKPKGGRIW